MKEIIKRIVDFLSTNYWISLVSLVVILVLLVILIVVSAKSRKKNKALNMSIIGLRKELLELKSSYESSIATLSENKLAVERALKDSINERDELRKNINEKSSKNAELEKETNELKYRLDSLLKVIEIKKEQVSKEPVIDTETKPNNDEKLAELKSKKRKELFKLAHECGLHDFAQWKNEKLIDEIYKSKYLNNGGENA